MYEPLLLHGVTPPHRDWPGRAIRLADELDPHVVGLLDGLDASALV